jgi:hypothetical protein
MSPSSRGMFGRVNYTLYSRNGYVSRKIQRNSCIRELRVIENYKILHNVVSVMYVSSATKHRINCPRLKHIYDYAHDADIYVPLLERLDKLVTGTILSRYPRLLVF